MAQGELQPVDLPPPLRHAVYEVLEERIIYGHLAPGEHLVETELARVLGVSRAPVREALQLLYRDGWVDLRPRQGAFVHRPSLREVDETFLVRTLLEVESARLAAQSCSDEDVRGLREILARGDKAFELGDEKALVIENSAFHGKVTDIAGNGVLAEMIHRLDRRIRWYFAPVVKRRALGSWKEHQQIVAAIERHDEEAAAEQMRSHAEMTRVAYHALREAEPLS